MEKDRFYKLVIIILLVINIATLSIFFLKGQVLGPNDHTRKKPSDIIIEELDFNDKQIKEFNFLKVEHQIQMRSLHDSMRLEREKLPDIILQENEKMVDSVSTNIARYQKQIEVYTYLHFVKVKNLCNDDQKNQFKSIINDILKMMGEKNHRPPLHNQ